MREKHQLTFVGKLTPNWGLNPQPRHVPPDWEWNQRSLAYWMMPNQPSHTNQVHHLCFPSKPGRQAEHKSGIKSCKSIQKVEDRIQAACEFKFRRKEDVS